MSQDLNPKQITGCIGGILVLLVTLPIWYILLWGILERTDAPEWQWVLYIIYMPASVIANLLTKLAEHMVDE